MKFMPPDKTSPTPNRAPAAALRTSAPPPAVMPAAQPKSAPCACGGRCPKCSAGRSAAASSQAANALEG
jgi:hypothetical protein